MFTLALAVRQQAPPKYDCDMGEREGNDEDVLADSNSFSCIVPITAPQLDLYSIRSFATTMVDNMHISTADIVNSCKQTDWSSEIQAFRQELEQDARQVAQSLASHTVLLPSPPQSTAHEGCEDAHTRGSGQGAALPLLGFNTTANTWLSKLEVPSQLARIGRNLYSGTADLIAQANILVCDELKKTRKEEQLMATQAIMKHILQQNTPTYSTTSSENFRPSSSGSSTGGSRYSLYEVQVLALQEDIATYAEPPQDAADFAKFKASFCLASRAAESYALAATNMTIATLQAELVPASVAYEVFWTRYWYRLHKLQEAYEVHMQAVNRTLAAQHADEEFSWEDDEVDGQEQYAHGEAAFESQPASDKEDATEEAAAPCCPAVDSHNKEWEADDVDPCCSSSDMTQADGWGFEDELSMPPEMDTQTECELSVYPNANGQMDAGRHSSRTPDYEQEAAWVADVEEQQTGNEDGEESVDEDWGLS